ncbi:hypothetical protein ABZU76_41305 [Amycolatopsis sp. NPDC005232]|uniref:hypothetical protein n=1 Tax=Amycolatopsis sp. NPDC005232 TaxID=3157027 RepID=UPI0033BE9F93
MTEALPGVRLGVVRGISYGLFGEPGEFVPQARALGAGLLRAYVFWSQVEPRPGEHDWTAVDALLAQLDGDEEVWLTVCSSSPWATKVSTDFLPPSPAHDPAVYGRFVRELVRRCAGRVKFWQCDNEPSNTGLLWAGTAEEYVTQLKVLHEVVKDVDPAALVVLGGCGYDVFSSEPGSEPRRFFDHLVSAGREHFDVFSAHLYGDPLTVPSSVDAARAMMAAYGEPKPIVAGEHGGPVPFEFPELESVMQQAFLSAFADAPATQSTGELQERAARETPERAAMRSLYSRMAELPPRLRMFLDGCPPELDALRDRIGCRQLVVRTVLALAAGIRRTAYWNLAPEVPGPVDPLQMMHLLFGKLPLLGYRGRSLEVRRPMADTFSLVAEQLAGAERVSRMDAGVQAYAVERAGRGPLVVVWDQRDPVDGEQEPPVPVTLPWTAPEVVAVDAFGAPVSVRLESGSVRLDVSLTPAFVSGR